MTTPQATYRFYVTKDWASNFHPSRITYNNLTGDTVEHVYQACKFIRTDPNYAQFVLNAPTPSMAKKRGSARDKQLDPDWEKVYANDPFLGETRYKDWVMYSILKEKISNQHFESLLLSTNDMILMEDSPTDFYWGGRNKGRNMLGKLLMVIRSEIRTKKNQQ